MCALSSTLTEYLYSNYVVQIIHNDIADACPLFTFLFVCFYNVGLIEKSRVQSFYLAVFQAFITILGIVFMFGVFILQTRNLANIQYLKDALIGFSSLYTLVILLTLLGILISNCDIDFSHDNLSSLKVSKSNFFNISIFFGTLCLTAASTAYLFFVLLIFLK